ncbi:hypothetical protein C8D77_12816 [Mesorhizobium loti]|uniref:Uncharacterized protein n=1 Tax=Rhizobium loti TaxID=381 RepID=A0A8E2W5L4_RHILI|nr:hypothetical protein C8D77_12816 [Mesorhizobium loti]
MSTTSGDEVTIRALSKFFTLGGCQLAVLRTLNLGSGIVWGYDMIHESVQTVMDEFDR